MKNTTNFNFKKPELSDVINPDDFNENSDSIDKILFNSSRMEVAQGTSNEIILTNVTYENGDIKNFIAKSNNNGSSTTINGKNVYRAGTNEPPTFIEKKAYTVWYDLSGDCFFTKANAEGTAIASQVLAGTTFSNNIDTNIQGELPVNPYINSVLNCGESITIPYGFIPGGIVKANSLASQTSATAESNKVLKGYTFWKNGTRYTGNIPFLQAQTITPGTSNIDIDPGKYINGPQTIKGDPNLIASNIVSGKSIFNVAGSANVYNLGGIKYDIGSVACKKSSEPFSKEGAAPYTQPIAEITGLSFRPKYGFVFRYDTEIINIGLFDNYNFYLKNDNSKFVFRLTDYNNGTYLIGNGYIRFPLVANNELGKEYKYFVFG